MGRAEWSEDKKSRNEHEHETAGRVSSFRQRVPYLRLPVLFARDEGLNLLAGLL